jgi:hypothetical protein
MKEVFLVNSPAEFAQQLAVRVVHQRASGGRTNCAKSSATMVTVVIAVAIASARCVHVIKDGCLEYLSAELLWCDFDSVFLDVDGIFE